MKKYTQEELQEILIKQEIDIRRDLENKYFGLKDIQSEVQTSDAIVKKALKLSIGKLKSNEYIVGNKITYNEKFKKWECSCSYNKIKHKTCSHLMKFYLIQKKMEDKKW